MQSLNENDVDFDRDDLSDEEDENLLLDEEDDDFLVDDDEVETAFNPRYHTMMDIDAEEEEEDDLEEEEDDLDELEEEEEGDLLLYEEEEEKREWQREKRREKQKRKREKQRQQLDMALGVDIEVQMQWEQLRERLMTLVQGVGTVYSTVSTTGGYKGSKTSASLFKPGSRCKECLRKLHRLLVKDMRRDKGVWKLLFKLELFKQLIALISSQRESYSQLVTWALRILSAMTLPPTVTERQERAEKRQALQRKKEQKKQYRPESALFRCDLAFQNRVLREYKQTFVSEDGVANVMFSIKKPADGTLSNKIFVVDSSTRDGGYLARIKYSVQTLVNITRIRDPVGLVESSSVVNLHDQLIAQFMEYSMFDFVLLVISGLLESMEQGDEAGSVLSSLSEKQKLVMLVAMMEFCATIVRMESPMELFRATRKSTATSFMTASTGIGLTITPVTPSTPTRPSSNSSFKPTPNTYNKSLLSSILEKEKRQKTMAKQAMPTRHSRFGGVLVHKPVSGEQDDNLEHQHNPTIGVTSIVMDQFQAFNKGKRKPVLRSRLIARDEVDTHDSSTEIKRIVRSFSTELLKTCFQGMMTHIWNQLQDEHNNKYYSDERLLLPVDEYHFTMLLHYMLEFNRCMFLHKTHQYRERLERDPLAVQPTFDISRISLLLEDNLLHHLFELCTTSKRERRWMTMAKAVGALKEMFMTMEIMYHSTEPAYVEKTKQLLQNLLYDPSRADQIIKLVKEYDDTKSSKRHLCNVIELVHVFLRLIQSRTAKSSIMTRKKYRRGRRKKKRVAGKQIGGLDPETAQRDGGFMVADKEREEEDYMEKEDEEDYHAVDPDSLKHFDFDYFLEKISCREIVRHYTRLLVRYFDNPARINHYVVHMFMRIYLQVGRKMMLFPLSVLRTFNQIMSDRLILREINRLTQDERLTVLAEMRLYENDSMEEDMDEIVQSNMYMVEQDVLIKRKYMYELYEFCARVTRDLTNLIRQHPVLITQIVCSNTQSDIDLINVGLGIENDESRGHYVTHMDTSDDESEQARRNVRYDRSDRNENVSRDESDGEYEISSAQVHPESSRSTRSNVAGRNRDEQLLLQQQRPEGTTEEDEFTALLLRPSAAPVRRKTRLRKVGASSSINDESEDEQELPEEDDDGSAVGHQRKRKRKQ